MGNEKTSLHEGQSGQKGSGNKTEDIPVKYGASVEELARRMVSTDNSDDDLAKMIAHNWKSLAGIVAVVAFGIVIFESFQSTRQKKSGEVAALFSEAQAGYQLNSQAEPAATPAGTNAPKDEKKSPAAVAESLRMLSTSYGDEIYGRLATLYQASMARQQGNYPQALSLLSTQASGAVNSLFSTAQAKSSKEVENNDLVTELTALSSIRVILDEGKEPLAQVRSKLRGLAYGSRFVTAEALLTLFRISETKEEKDQAQAVAKDVLTARASLQGEIERLMQESDIQL